MEFALRISLNQLFREDQIIRVKVAARLGQLCAARGESRGVLRLIHADYCSPRYVNLCFLYECRGSHRPKSNELRTYAKRDTITRYAYYHIIILLEPNPASSAMLLEEQ